LWVAYPLVWFYRISYPLVWLLNWVSQWLLRLVGLQTGNEAGKAHSEDEMRLVFSGSPQRIGRGSLGRDIVLNALDLRRRVVREVMRPRQEMVVLNTEATIAECLEIADKTRYSRFPLCRSGDLDQTLGVVHIKDLYAMRLKARTGADLVPVIRKLVYVPETAHLEKLLQLFLDRKLHLGIVLDEYGGTMGMATLENILEELVGQIQDEFDQEKPLLLKTSAGTWEAAGTLPLHDLAELVGESLAEEDVTTASGWLTQKLGGFPRAGNHVVVGDFELRVEEMDGPRVAKIKIIRFKAEAGPTAATAKETE
jgi:CBS domain containing-hemolysin-like protein